MKLLVALTIALVLTGANAGFLDSLKDTFRGIKDNFSKVFQSITPVLGQAANNILTELKKDAGSILSTGLQALTKGTATRDLAVMDKIGQFLAKGQSAISDLSSIVGKVFNGALSKITDLVQQISKTDMLGVGLPKIISEITDVVANHNAVQGTILQKLMENPGEILSEAVQHLTGLFKHNKRDLASTLSSIGKSITDTFKPFINTLTQHISNIGSAVKNVGSTLLSAVKPTVDALKTKLSGHISTLKNVGQTLLGHGKNAISALTDAVTDILGQTFTNAKGTIQKAVETAKDAGNVAVNHLVGTLTGSN